LNVVRHREHGPVRSVELGYAPIGKPWMTARLYHFDDVVIDTGPSRLRREALAAIDGLPVRQILLTHHHEDHSGNAAAMKRATGAPVRGHAISADKLARGFPIMPYQHLFWGRAEPVEVEPLDGPVESANHRLEPIHTPGHSKDHVAYLERDRGWLFSGDLFLGERIKYFRVDERMDDQIRSLRRVLEHDFDALFCAHNPRPTDGKRHLARKLDFLESLRDEALDLHEQGYPKQQIVHRLARDEDRTIRWVTMGNVSFAHMVRSALEARA
jgi:glyoxylase-like metal-dependent hydrolase (beta-lactamase superfamily II)